MEVNRRLFLTAGIITALIFTSIYSLNLILGDKREDAILNRMEEINEEFSEMQTITYLMRVYGENITCIALREQMSYLDEKIWKLGEKIDSYRKVTEEFSSDPFYINQKKRFNRQEVVYLTMMRDMKEKCGIDQLIVLYFYGKCDENGKCDEQSFVLTYINKKIDPEIALYSFDTDLDLPSIDILKTIYNITELPAIVVEDETYEGFHDRGKLEEILCSHQNLSICKPDKQVK